MKKLLTLLSAATVAIGLYADDFATGTSFEGLQEGSLGISDKTGELDTESQGNFWATNGTVEATVVKDQASCVQTASGNRASQFADADYQETYLSLKTTFGNALTRNVNAGGGAQSIGDGIYFDSLVKFTAFDSCPTNYNAINFADAKIAVWVQTDENETSTNLYVMAGNLNGGSEIYDCGAFYPKYAPLYGEWHRLTIKAISNIYSGDGDSVPGFVVYVDKEMCGTGKANTKGIVEANVASKYAGAFNEGALFPSMDQTGTLSTYLTSVAFDGQGDLDDIVFTETAPDFAKDDEYVTVDWNAAKNDLASITVGGVAQTIADGSCLVKFSENPSQVIIGLTYVEGKVGPASLTNDFIEADTVYYVAAAQDAAASVSVNGTKISYADITDAAAAAFASNGTPLLKLFGGTSSSDSIALGSTAAAADCIMIDLNGQEIGGINFEHSTVCIYDSNASVTGTVHGTVKTGLGSIISNGVYEAYVEFANDTLVAGGKFKVGETENTINDFEDFYQTPTGYKFAVVDGYIVLVEDAEPTWSVILGAADVDGAYTIDDANDLVALQNGVFAGLATEGEKFKQTANIDMTGVADFYGIGWFTSSDNYASLPTGVTNKQDIAFAGIYDGQNHTISNVTIVRHNYAGVFNNVEGTVKDLTVQDIGFSGTCAEWGCAIVGNSQRDAVLENLTAVTSSGFNWGDSANHNVAGIVVRPVDSSIVRGCVNNAAISAVAKRVGGIAAFVGNGPAGSKNVQFISCTNNAAILSTDGTRGVGGILGCAEGGTDENATIIKDCVDFGSETAQASGGHAGAIVGSNWNGTNTYTDDGGNTFRATTVDCGYVKNAVFGRAYAVDAGIEGYLKTVKATDLAKGNTYTLLIDIAASETPVITLDDAAETIAFKLNGCTFAGTIASSHAGVEAVPATVDGVITYTATITDGWAYRLGNPVDGAYVINDAAELSSFKEGVATLGTSGKTFKLGANIDASSLGYWDGIGTYGTANTGLNAATFDGAGYTISNLSFSNGKYRAFFNRVDSSTIKDLTINVVDIAQPESASAEHGYSAFAGKVVGSTIKGCTATGTIGTTAKPAMHTCGGFAVATDGGTTFVDCTNYISVVCSLNDNPKIGGIVGLVQGSAASVVSNCWNFGDMTITANGVKAAANGAGGLVGYAQVNLTIYGGGNEGTITWSKSTTGDAANNAVKTGTVIGLHASGGRTTVTGGTVAQADAAPAGAYGMIDGLNFATVDGNVATFVADTALAAGNTYKVMNAAATATYQFMAPGTIAFNTALATPSYDITAVSGITATPSTDGSVTTYTAAVTGWQYYLGEAVDNAYTIDNLADLNALATGVQAGLSTVGVTFKQTADIDMTDAGAFAGIGSYEKVPTSGTPFLGTYNGQGYTISNVTRAGGNTQGIFNQVGPSGVIENLVVSNMVFDADVTGEYGFAIVGNAGGGATLRNLTAAGVFGAADKASTHNIAGIVVRLSPGATADVATTVDSCTNNATIYGGYTKLGGICAIAQQQTGFSAGKVVFNNCANNGTLVCKRTAADVTGNAGIVGYVATSNVELTGCYGNGVITNSDGANTNCDGALVGTQYKGYTLKDNGGNSAPANKKMIATYGNQANVTGFQYATVDNNGVATTVAGALAAGNTYLLEGNVAASETPVFTLAAAGDTIAFDAALGYTFAGTVAAGTGLGLSVTSATVGTVTTYTAAVPAPQGLDPEDGTTNVTVTAESAEAAIAGVAISAPAGSGVTTSEQLAAYKSLFNIVATDNGNGTFDVAITGLKDEAVAGVDESAIEALTDADTDTIAIPAGLYYRITPSADLSTWGTAQGGLSTGTVDAPAVSGTGKGFYKVELSATPIQ